MPEYQVLWALTTSTPMRDTTIGTSPVFRRVALRGRSAPSSKLCLVMYHRASSAGGNLSLLPSRQYLVLTSTATSENLSRSVSGAVEGLSASVVRPPLSDSAVRLRRRASSKLTTAASMVADPVISAAITCAFTTALVLGFAVKRRAGHVGACPFRHRPPSRPPAALLHRYVVYRHHGDHRLTLPTFYDAARSVRLPRHA